MAAMRLSHPISVWLGLQTWRSMPVSNPRGRSLPTLSFLALRCWIFPSSTKQHHGSDGAVKVYVSGNPMFDLSRLAITECVQEGEKAGGDQMDAILSLNEGEQWIYGSPRPGGPLQAADDGIGIVVAKVVLEADSISKTGKIVWVALAAGVAVNPGMKKRGRGRHRGSKKKRGQPLGARNKSSPVVLASQSDGPSVAPVSMPPCPSLKGKEFA